MRGLWPVVRSSRSGHRGPPPTRETVRKSGAFVATVFVLSALTRFVVRRRASLPPARLFEVVERNRARFVRVTIADGHDRDSIVFARWDEIASAYLTVSGVRVTTDGEERLLAPSIPVEYGPGMLRPSADARALSVPVHATMWLLARFVEARESAGLRAGTTGDATLEPILDRFVVVRDANGPDAPAVYSPGPLEALLYPGLLAVVVLVVAWSLDDPESALGWLFGAVLILGFVELLAWSLLFVQRRR